MNAFLTGSRAYGIPNEKSDIDICVLMDPKDAEALALLRDSDYDDVVNFSLRFGQLNLLVMTEAFRFRAWQTATEELVARRPVTREQAIQLIDEKILEAMPLEEF